MSCKQIPVNNSGKTLVEKAVNLQSSSLMICLENQYEYLCKRTGTNLFYAISKDEWINEGHEHDFDRVLRTDLLSLIERIKFFCKHRRRDCTKIELESDNFKQFIIQEKDQ